MSEQRFSLFSEGNMVHVAKLADAPAIFGGALLSPLEKAKKAGRTIPAGTFFHPADNLYVKFLRFDSADVRENFSSLHDHFSTFGGGQMEALGYITSGEFDIRLWENQDYVGIATQVPLPRLTAIVVPLVPMMRKDVDHLASPRNRRIVLATVDLIHQAWLRGQVRDELSLVDHFGRKIQLF